MRPTSASVVICAYTDDRWDDVLAAVESVRVQSHGALETLLVIDHNPSLLAAFEAHLPEVHVLANEEAQGLSGGRNTGVRAARGDVVAFLDDDAVADPDWLKYFLARYDEDVLGVGGLTLPAWDDRRPPWWPREFDWVVGCTFVGREPGPVRNLLGGNASFRRSALLDVGGFRTHIGRTAERPRPLGCEETELCIRMGREKHGGRFLFEDRSVIHHRVPSARGTWTYFRSRCYAEGLSKALVAESVGATAALSEERRHVTGALRHGVVRGLLDALRRQPGAAARTGAIVAGLAWTIAGYIAGTVSTSRTGGRR